MSTPRSQRSFFYLSLISASTLATGCGGAAGPELGRLSGTVTLDGKPLANARIVFQPTGQLASPSVSDTAEDGAFELRFNRDRKGVLPGSHQIRVTTARVVTDASGKETDVQEVLPAKYNAKTELTYDVKTGSNQLDLKLESSQPGYAR